MAEAKSELVNVKATQLKIEELKKAEVATKEGLSQQLIADTAATAKARQDRLAAESSLKAIQDEVSTANENLQTVLAQKADLEVKARNLASDEARQKELSVILDARKKDISDKEQELSQKSADLMKVEQDLESANSELTRIKSTQINIEDLKKQVSDIQALLVGLNAQKQELDKAVEDTKLALAKVGGELEAKNAQLSIHTEQQMSPALQKAPSSGNTTDPAPLPEPTPQVTPSIDTTKSGVSP